MGNVTADLGNPLFLSGLASGAVAGCAVTIGVVALALCCIKRQQTNSRSKLPDSPKEHRDSKLEDGTWRPGRDGSAAGGGNGGRPAGTAPAVGVFDEDKRASLLDNEGGGVISGHPEFDGEMLASFLSVMADGVACTWHRDGHVHKQVRLALKGGERLVWGSHGKKPKNSMALGSVVDVHVGGGSPMFEPGTDPALCLTLACRDGSTLDIEVSTELEAAGIAEGIRMAVDSLEHAGG